MLPTRLVADASVVIKWFNKEQDRGRAIEIRSAHLNGTSVLLAPSLLPYEICNALRHSNDYDEAKLNQAIEALRKIGITYKDLDADMLAETVKNAYQYNITAYDASYLACAVTTDTVLITADEKLYNKTKESGRITLLKDFELI